jgi:hypothetical protein
MIRSSFNAAWRHSLGAWHTWLGGLAALAVAAFFSAPVHAQNLTRTYDDNPNATFVLQWDATRQNGTSVRIEEFFWVNHLPVSRFLIFVKEVIGSTHLQWRILALIPPTFRFELMYGIGTHGVGLTYILADFESGRVMLHNAI